MSEATSAPARLPGAAAATAVVVAVTGIRLAVLALSNLNLYGDEAQYWSWAQDPAFGYVSKPPLVAWIIAATTAVCGDGEFCVRLASPLIHGATGAMLFLLGRELFDTRVGFWACVTYVTLPAVSYSSGLVSTDVPLLFFWSVALYAFVRLSRTGQMRWVLLLGVALGLGLLSKYAMAYFLVCALVYGALSADGRRAVLTWRAAAALALGLVIVAPNLWWNIQHGWATFSHTAANANWSGPLFHPNKLLEFVGAQFGVFGPLLFAALLWWLAARRPWRGDQRERLLFAFAVPVLAIVTVQSLLSRAHANWAAVTYTAATVAVVAWLAQRDRRHILRASFVLHLAAAAMLYGLVVAASGGGLPARLDVFARLRGWDVLGRQVAALMAQRPGAAVLTDDRMVMAELLYYSRDAGLPIVIQGADGPPRNQYELVAPLAAATGGRLLYVTAWSDPQAVLRRFAAAHPLPPLVIAERPGRRRIFYLYDLETRPEQ